MRFTCSRAGYYEHRAVYMLYSRVLRLVERFQLLEEERRVR